MKRILLLILFLPIFVYGQNLNKSNGKWEFDGVVNYNVANVIIIAGQSNAKGSAINPPAYLQGNLPAYVYNFGGFEVLTNSNNNFRHNINVGFGAELSLAYKYYEATGDSLYFLKYAVNATNMTAAEIKDDWSINSTNEQYDSLKIYIDSAIYYIETVHKKKINYLGFIWMQGEGDAAAEGYAAAYALEQYNFFNAVRAYIGYDIPIYDFRIGYNTAAYASTIRLAKDSVATVLSDVYLIDGDSTVYPFRSDHLHLNDVAQIGLGNRLCDLILGADKHWIYDTNNVVYNSNTSGTVKLNGGLILQNDTLVNAVVGRVIYQAADSTFYGCRSTVANKKWYPLN